MPEMETDLLKTQNYSSQIARGRLNFDIVDNLIFKQLYFIYLDFSLGIMLNNFMTFFHTLKSMHLSSDLHTKQTNKVKLLIKLRNKLTISKFNLPRAI
jgi:hypothetical protein